MDLNFNNYICSVIALSLINLSNFWGAVHFAKDGAKQMIPVFAGILILGVNYEGYDRLVHPERVTHHTAAVIYAPIRRGREMRAALFSLTPSGRFRRGRGCGGDTWMGDAGGAFSPDPTEPSPAVKGMRGRYVDGRCVFYGERGIGLRGKVCDLNSHQSHLTPSTLRQRWG